MKILITGALGYIGNEVIQSLLNCRINILAIDNSDIAYKKFYPLWQNQIDFINEDVCEFKCPSDVDLIIHLAAEVGYIACDKNPELAIKTNIEGTKRVASFNKPTLFFSTGSVYGKLDEICTERTQCNPTSLYSKTKLEGEKIISYVPHCIVRPVSAFGVSYKTRSDLLVHTLAKSAINGRVELYQPNAIRSVYNVSKIADFVLHCILNWSNFQGNLFNLGCEGCTLSKKDIVLKLKNLCDFDLVYVEGEDLEVRDYFVDYTKLKSVWDHSEDNIDSHLLKLINHFKSENS